MNEPLKLMCVLAHPDEESLSCGGTIAKYAHEGVQVSVVTATRGERGWARNELYHPARESLGNVREGELRAAARILGIHELILLGYIDGDLDQVDPVVGAMKIAAHIRRVRPQVVITFDPFGSYGHPDHIAISQFALGAVVAATDVGHLDAIGNPPFQVSKLYYMADTQALVDMLTRVIGEPMSYMVDGVTRRHIGWPDWSSTTRIDVAAYWEQTLRAIACHQSQVEGMFERIKEIPQQAPDKTWWGEQTFYRVFSLVNGGRQVETDLFAGLRESREMEPSHR